MAGNSQEHRLSNINSDKPDIFDVICGALDGETCRDGQGAAGLISDFHIEYDAALVDEASDNGCY